MQNTSHTLLPAVVAAALIFASCGPPPPSPSVWEKSLNPPASGADAGPLIAQALGELRAAASGGKLERAVLRFGAGEYPLTQTLVLNRAALGDFAGELVLEGPAQGEAVLLGSVPVEGWQPAPATDLAPAAAGKVWVAALATGGTKALFDGEGLLPRARSRGFIPPKEGAKPTEFSFPPDLLPDGVTTAGLELSVRPSWMWIHNILPVASLDLAAGRGSTAIPATYAIAPIKDWAPSNNPSAWFENRAMFIRKPGDWATSPDGQSVYLWPRGGEKPAGIRAARLIELLRIEGDEAGGKPLAGVSLRGLTFSQADRESIAPDDAGLQHDWDFYDKANAMLRLRWVDNITVENCRFINSGAAGLRADLYAQNVRVLGNTFSGLGGGGILFCGYGPGTKDLNKNNVIHGNLVEDCGRLIWHSPGIHLWQSGGNKVTRNLLRDLPYSGIIVSGVGAHCFRNADAPAREMERTVRWGEVPMGQEYTVESIQPFLHSKDNLVAGNEVTRVMRSMGDGNGIYVRFASETGNVLRGNYIHNITAPRLAGGIRCDDLQHGVLLENNLVVRTTKAGINSKGRNPIRNNFIVDVVSIFENAERFATRALSYLSFPSGHVIGGEITGNVLLSTGGDQMAFYHFTTMPWDQMPAPSISDLALSRNLYWVQGNPPWAQDFVADLHRRNLDPGSVAADPGMKTGPDGRITFDPAVLARQQITPFDWDNVGLPDGTNFD